MKHFMMKGMICLTMLSALFSCCEASDSRLTYLSLCINNTMVMGADDYFEAALTEDGNHVSVKICHGEEERITNVNKGFMEELEAIVKTYKMRSYKEKYRSRVEVSDGSLWGVELKFSDGKTVSSRGGTAAWPRKGPAALSAIKKAFEDWMEEGGKEDERMEEVRKAGL